MLFCSSEFVAFFAVVFTAYWAIPWPRLRVLLLVAASFFFYASWSASLALVVAGSSTCDFLLALGMDRTSSERKRKLLCATSVLGNVGLLVYFKYANFFLRALEDSLRVVGAEASFPVLAIVLPIGISFYTFEAINYTVSVYRREVRAERDLPSFMLFILFFPHLVAGPIVRARDFLPQTHRTKRWSWPRLHAGVQLLVLGLVKKLVIADHLARTVDPVFAAPQAHTQGAVWCAAFAWEIQCYCDFSGYSDLALGLAHMFGYRLAVNFDVPFLSTSVAEFWRRWHISLMTWLRDYIYRPLGGSRGGLARTSTNVLITMTLAGLWHGSKWTFVLWGFASGVILVLHRLFVMACARSSGVERALTSLPGTALRVLATFTIIAVSSVSFRAESLASMRVFFERMFEGGGTEGAPRAVLAYGLLVLVAVAHLLSRSRAPVWLARAPAPLQGVVYGVGVAAALVLAPGDAKTFIYFQF